MIWVLGEVIDGRPSPVSLELVSGARSLTDAVEVVTFGGIGEAVAATFGAYGAATVHEVGDLANSLPAPRVAAAIAAAVQSGSGPSALFVASTYTGRDIAARCSARLDRPVLTNIVGVSGSEGSFITEHALFGGTEIAKARFNDDGVGIYVIRPKTFMAEEIGGTPAEVIALAGGDPGSADGAKIVATHAEERTGPRLDAASVVVSGGRGLGAASNYALIERLAQLLHGAPGASRAVVDAGWVPYAYQVGQTGTIVKPSVYLAFGISGATQHLVGMKGANRIIAVNKDPEAPILKIADLGVVGDALEILPKLIEAIEART